MELNLELSKNLYLCNIEENNYSNGKLIAVECFFRFFGEEGTAFISIDKLDGEWPSYGIIEICSELCDSFEELLEDEENWAKIVSAIKEFVKQWEIENEQF